MKAGVNQKGRSLLTVFNIHFVICIILDTICHNIIQLMSHLWGTSFKLDLAILTVFPDFLSIFHAFNGIAQTGIRLRKILFTK